MTGPNEPESREGEFKNEFLGSLEAEAAATELEEPLSPTARQKIATQVALGTITSPNPKFRQMQPEALVGLTIQKHKEGRVLLGRIQAAATPATLTEIMSNIIPWAKTCPPYRGNPGYAPNYASILSLSIDKSLSLIHEYRDVSLPQQFAAALRLSRDPNEPSEALIRGLLLDKLGIYISMSTTPRGQERLVPHAMALAAEMCDAGTLSANFWFIRGFNTTPVELLTTSFFRVVCSQLDAGKEISGKGFKVDSADYLSLANQIARESITRAGRQQGRVNVDAAIRQLSKLAAARDPNNLPLVVLANSIARRFHTPPIQAGVVGLATAMEQVLMVTRPNDSPNLERMVSQDEMFARLVRHLLIKAGEVPS